MPLRPQTGNMYSFITHTINMIKGKCSHDCVYCYMKRFKQNPIRLDEKELKANLGEDNFIFVGSSTDMWAPDVPQEWIELVLFACLRYPDNRYLFQSKRPDRFNGFTSLLGKENVILGTTLETNIDTLIGGIAQAPPPVARAYRLGRLAMIGYKTMVTVEPVMEFDLEPMTQLIMDCHPEWVNIGADSKGHNLPEPSMAKVNELISVLRDEGIKVKTKSNLKRLGVE